MKKISLLLVLFVILVSVSSLADIDTGYPCSLDCEALADNGDSYYCNFETGTCFQTVETAPVNESLSAEPAVAASPSSMTTEEKVVVLEENLVLLQSSLLELSTSSALTNQDIATIKDQLVSLEGDLATLKGSIDQQISQGNTVATGLAGLQQGVEKTQETLTVVQDTLSKRQALNRFITITVLVLLIGGVAGGIFYYVNRKQRKISPEIGQYITRHIRQGKKFPQIKQQLLSAGWDEQDIDWAYKETTKQNYRRYKGTTEPRKEMIQNSEKKERETNETKPGFGYDPKKMISIAVVSVLLIVGILFVLRGVTTGKAIQFQKLVGGEEGGTSGEVTYAVECTPPHIVNPSGDACCLDVDNSGVCDTAEARQGQVTGGVCQDNNQCPRGEFCVDGNCKTLASLYSGAGDCTKLCSYYAVKMLTSDGETYSIKPNRGSYTAAGALEWKLLEMPQHCKGETPIVPVNIILKRPGEIVSEEVITLQQGEKSEALMHPDLPQIAFTLTADTVFETCPK